jgi:hypothetical protein
VEEWKKVAGWVRPISAATALAAALWAAVLWLGGGIAFDVAGIRFSSSNPLRPLVVAAIFAVGYGVLSGTSQLRRDTDAFRRHLTAARSMSLLIVVTLVVGLAHNSWTAGGSDAYSYVSQADLWLAGKMSVQVPLAGKVPWPNGLATFTPFGYRPLPDEDAIAPMVGPGLPLLMAAFKFVAGHPAAFVVTPLSGALFLWATFLVGRRIGSESLGLGAAWLVATSPTFLMIFKSQLSDVPAAAFWTLATYWALGSSVRSATAAGLATSMASSKPCPAGRDPVFLAHTIQQQAPYTALRRRRASREPHRRVHQQSSVRFTTIVRLW